MLSRPLTEVSVKGDEEFTVRPGPYPYPINVRAMELALVVVSVEPTQLGHPELAPKPDRTIPLVVVPEVSTAIPVSSSLVDALAERLMV
jgi:hypothetical protein